MVVSELIVYLTHWGRVTHICVGKLTIIGSDNGLSPGWRKAIIWTNAGILLIGPLKANFSEILIEILYIFIQEMHLNMSSGKWWPFCLGFIVLTHRGLVMPYGVIVFINLHSGDGMLPVWCQAINYLNQFWHYVNWTFRNIPHWNTVKPLMYGAP